VLSVDNIWAKGRHTPLFDRTTFSVGEGEVIIVQADSQLERTSLALALTGRLPLSGGTISWSEGDDEPRPISMKRLRALSSVVDSPDVTAPEQHMRVHDYVSEMLSYNLPIFGRSRASRWLAERGLEDLDGLWMDEISGEMNIELMAALAQHSPSDLLVFDTPSRHLNHTYMWLPYLEELAADEDHPRTVAGTPSAVMGCSTAAGGPRAPHSQRDCSGARSTSLGNRGLVKERTPAWPGPVARPPRTRARPDGRARSTCSRAPTPIRWRCTRPTASTRPIFRPTI